MCAIGDEAKGTVSGGQYYTVFSKYRGESIFKQDYLWGVQQGFCEEGVADTKRRPESVAM